MTYRFSWTAFDDRTVAALASAEGHVPGVTPRSPRAFLETAVKRPDEAFVRRNKDALARAWIPAYDGRRAIVDRLREAGLGTSGYPRSPKGYGEYVARCPNRAQLRRVLLESLLRFGDRDRSDADLEADSYVPRFAILEPSLQPADTRTPRDYQLETWRALDRAMSESERTGSLEGIIAIPTGGGKSYTAVRWLMQNVVSRGMRVLWIAHRHELLRHAAAEFHLMAGLAEGVDRLRVRIVSGKHCAVTQIDPADHIVVASIHSLRAREDLRKELLSDPRLVVVIDEAHHAPAKSYRRLIQELRRTRPYRLIGLTATPTRTVPSERPVLSALFGGHVFHSVDLRRLVERRTLARPRLVTVSTGAKVERGVTDEDLKHLARYHDLSAAWLKRIGEIAERNRFIVNHYVEHRQTYGKTLVFAVDVAHAALLADQLRDRGVRADYVAYYRPDHTEKDCEALIQALRDGDLDVLVNVQKLTEGVDLPDVQSIFLTRPTRSEILFRQMVGRGLRGPLSGGTEHAYLVAFDDQWERYRDWEHPFDLVPDLVELSDSDDTPHARVRQEFVELLPWDVIRDAARRLRQIAPEQIADVFEAIPHGWYLLEWETDEGAVRHPIPVYAHQHPGWEALLDALWTGEPAAVGAAMRFDAFFDDCADPLPAERDIDLALDHLEEGGERPVFTSLEERRLSDPYELAKSIRDGDLGESARAALVEERYGPLARAIYASLRDYDAAIAQAQHALRFPVESRRAVRAVPVFGRRPARGRRPAAGAFG